MLQTRNQIKLLCILLATLLLFITVSFVGYKIINSRVPVYRGTFVEMQGGVLSNGNLC